MRLYLIRHPEPLIAKDICYGSTDVGVAPLELVRVLPTLLTTLPKGVRLFSSPLRRCAELAMSVAEALDNGSVRFDARLVEMHFGNWELCSWNNIPRAEIDAWANDPIAYQPGGGETVLQMAQRVRAFYDELLLAQQDCIVICHAGTIRLLLACQRNLPLSEIALYAAQTSHKIAYGEVTILDC
jgi:alpha-ribazole phosphatase